MIASPDGAVGVSPTAGERGCGCRQCSGSLINACLQDNLARIQEIALHGVLHGASVALTMAQVQTVYDLHAMEVGFPIGDGPEGHEDLIVDFTAAAEAIVDITSAQDVVNSLRLDGT